MDAPNVKNSPLIPAELDISRDVFSTNARKGTSSP